MATTTQTNLRPEIIQAREDLESARQKLLQQHHEGSPGIQVCNRFSRMIDDIALHLFESAITDLFPNHASIRSKVALIPHGGYGRSELAPYSDLDLMLLHQQGSLGIASLLAKRLVQDFSDLGIELGFSLRTIGQCMQMSVKDPIILTSLVEARCLGGSMKLFAKFQRKFSSVVKARSMSLIRIAADARRDERSRFGGTINLLEPNVKRSKGGLRDLQLLRWVGCFRYGNSDPDLLYRGGFLDKRDYKLLRRAQDFLLRVRNEIHFHANSSQDTLFRSEQMRVADSFGYVGSEGVSPVEKFMQEYFGHTEAIRHAVSHFVAGARWGMKPGVALMGYLASNSVGGDFLVGPVHVWATKQGLKKVTSDLAAVLQIMETSIKYDRRIDHPTWQAIREAMIHRTDHPVDQKTADHFLALLAHGQGLGRLLRRLHELRVLEKLVPGYDHARCLLQFNEYHKYTVDEHSLRAVERATEFESDDSLIGQVYREIEDKRLLHLALLVHDLGKGYVEDHCEVGKQIAGIVAGRLFLSTEESETVCFLVHRHLMLSHLAFRRDTSDENLVRAHADEIGSIQRLKMLFVLTCADFSAVGPDVLNQWKREVLCELYSRLKRYLDGTRTEISVDEIVAKLRANLLIDVDPSETWLQRQIEHLPIAFLEGSSSKRVLKDLRKLKEIKGDEIQAWGRYLSDRKAVEFSVGAIETQFPGAFHRLAGALTAQRMEILSAEIHNLADGIFLDRFYVHDCDHDEKPPASRFDEITQSLKKALSTNDEQLPQFKTTWGAQNSCDSVSLTDLPTRVTIDNKISNASTVIEVYAHDKLGLLYKITRTIFELGLSVVHAKIGTYLDQVVDVFYVTDFQGRKIESQTELQKIKSVLLQEVNQFAENVQ